MVRRTDQRDVFQSENFVIFFLQEKTNLNNNWYVNWTFLEWAP